MAIEIARPGLDRLNAYGDTIYVAYAPQTGLVIFEPRAVPIGLVSDADGKPVYLVTDSAGGGYATGNAAIAWETAVLLACDVAPGWQWNWAADTRIPSVKHEPVPAAQEETR